MRDWYATCVFWSTIAVIVGCAIEAPEVIHEVWPTLFAERFDRAIKVASSVGLLLVVLGVSGELTFEHWRSAYQEQLQFLDDTFLTEAQQRAATAELDAGDAERSAEDAADASNKAIGNAAKASQLATDARQEADGFEKDIVNAKSTAASAESHLADALQRAANAEAELQRLRTPRALFKADRFGRFLQRFPGTEYSLSTFQDDEAFELVRQIDAALQAAHWVRKQPAMQLNVPAINILGSNDPVPVCFDLGIGVHSAEKEPSSAFEGIPYDRLPRRLQVAIDLRDALANSVSPQDSRNVMPKVLVDGKGGEPQPVRICVGRKP